jgi:hypothetical protein
MLTRVLVALAVVLSGCAAEEQEERYTNKLVSCSVSLPQDWRDKLAANEVRPGPGKSVHTRAASGDGRTTVLLTWPQNDLELHTEDGQRRVIVSSVGTVDVVEFDGRRLTFVAISRPGQDAELHTWDAQEGGKPVQIDGEPPQPDHYRSSDGTTTVWTEDHRLFGQRADWPQPRLIAEIQKSDRVGRIGQPRVHGDFVSWWGMDSSYITDIRTGATVHTSDNYVLRVMGGALVLHVRERNTSPNLREGSTSATPLSGLSPLPAC